MKVQKKIKGQCLCGQVQYGFDVLLPHIAHCHCSMCRKFHGAAFATYGTVKASDFCLLKGKRALQTYTAANGTKRTFCKHCGSSLLFESANSDGAKVEIALGTLDSVISELPDAHIYADSKASWYAVEDDLAQFPSSRTSNKV